MSASNVTLSAFTSSELPVEFNVQGDAGRLKADGRTLQLERSGELTIWMRQSGDNHFEPFQTSWQAHVFDDRAVSHTISLNVPTVFAYSPGMTPIIASSSLGYPVDIQLFNGPAEVVRGRLYPTGPGEIHFTASFAGNDEYPAIFRDFNITGTGRSQEITPAIPSEIPRTDFPLTFIPTTTEGLPVSFFFPRNPRFGLHDVTVSRPGDHIRDPLERVYSIMVTGLRDEIEITAPDQFEMRPGKAIPVSAKSMRGLPVNLTLSANYNSNPLEPRFPGSYFIVAEHSGNDEVEPARAIQRIEVHAPALTIRRLRNLLVIEYETGTLQSSTNVSGGYRDVLGAQSPYALKPEFSPRFFRLRIP